MARKGGWLQSSDNVWSSPRSRRSTRSLQEAWLLLLGCIKTTRRQSRKQTNWVRQQSSSDSPVLQGKMIVFVNVVWWLWADHRQMDVLASAPLINLSTSWQVRWAAGSKQSFQERPWALFANSFLDCKKVKRSHINWCTGPLKRKNKKASPFKLQTGSFTESFNFKCQVVLCYQALKLVPKWKCTQRQLIPGLCSSMHWKITFENFSSCVSLLCANKSSHSFTKHREF